MLEIKDLKAYYGGVQVLWGVSLNVQAGKIVCLVGMNGAGKSTVMRVISGLVNRVEGVLRFEGQDLIRRTPWAIVSMGISQVPERRHVFPSLTVEENLMVGGFRFRRELRSSERRNQELDRIYRLFPRLRERHRQLAGSMSGGEQQMLAIGRALMARPRLLLMDEPSLGLSPSITNSILAAVRQLREQGTTILITEERARVALECADRGYVLRNGRVVVEGPAQELIALDKQGRLYEFEVTGHRPGRG